MTIICDHCNRSFDRKYGLEKKFKFCSISCRAAWTGQRRRERAIASKVVKPAPLGASWRWLPLTQGFHAKVDLIDFDELMKYSWAYERGYAKRTVEPNNRPQYLHRQIMEPAGQLNVDHINGDRLDNRRVNLRLCLQAQNSMNLARRSDNTSGHVGVYWNKQQQKWQALITLNGRAKHLGYFSDKEQAIEAREVGERAIFGEFAPSTSRAA